MNSLSERETAAETSIGTPALDFGDQLEFKEAAAMPAEETKGEQRHLLSGPNNANLHNIAVL